MKYGLGWASEREDYASLAATAKPFVLTQTYSAPRSINHRRWKRIKNQSAMGSCTGASRTNGEEVLNWIQTGGGIVELSMLYAYISNQRECGMVGRDNGATIDGSVRAAMKWGTCQETTCPYPDPVEYTTEIPEAAPVEGRKHLIKSHSVMRDYDDVFAWLASGVGVVHIGVPWGAGLANAGPVIEYREAKGGSYGGHALILSGYSEKRDSQGRQYIDMENSHSEDWGDKGWSLVAPEVIQYWCEQGNALIGISDLETFGPRVLPSWEGMWSS